MTAGVLHGQHPAPAGAEEGHRLQPELATHLFQIVYLGLDADVVGSDAVGRSAATALVVVNDPESLRQTVELWQQVLEVELCPAVQHHNHRAIADVADVQSSATCSHETGSRLHGSE
jgi:hypothetical protein